MKILFYYRGAESFAIESLSAVLKRAGHTTELIFDPGLDNFFYFSVGMFKKLNMPRRLAKKAKRFSPDIIAFSAFTNIYPYAREIAGILKSELNAFTIVGGIHATVLSETVLNESCFDAVCRGEGEYALLELANNLEQGKDITGIRNLWVKDKNGVVHRNDVQPLIRDLDTLPFSDKDLFYRNGAFWGNVSLMTARGCPYHCTYCINSIYHKMYGSEGDPVRRRSVQNVIDELKVCKRKYRPNTINILDDTFTSSTEWLESFASRYAADIRLPFTCSVHPVTVSSRNIKILKEAGCAHISMGVQSGNSELRSRLMQRIGTNEQIIEAGRLIRGAGIHLSTEFIFGLPEETPEMMWESVTLNRVIGPNNISTFLFYPFPGTVMADYCVEKGLLNRESLKKTHDGFGSYYSTLLLRHPHYDFAMNLAFILPLCAKLPTFFGDFLMKNICSRKFGRIARFLGLLGVPLMDTWAAKQHIQDILHMLWRVFRANPAAEETPPI